MSDRDLAHHYKVLKQFLDISDDQTSRSRAHSSRAERAREKLLKLSYTQFKELSTDVYDELKRRIDESKGEPDYLLPKNTFHPKRNQARQKLASLPQNRFKDLVSDISYELERRDLHKERNGSTTSSSFHQHTRSNSTNLLQKQSSHPQPPYHPDSYYPNEDHYHHHPVNNKSISSSSTHRDTVEEQPIEEEEEEPKQLQLPGLIHSETSHSLQATKVVPTKANLEWSSDEEEEEHEQVQEESHRYSFEKNSQSSEHLEKSFEAVPQEQHKEQTVEEPKEVVPVEENVHKVDSAELLQLQSRLEDIQQQLSQSHKEKEELQNQLESVRGDHDYSVTQNKSLSEELENIGQEKQAWSSKISDLEQELEKVKSANASLRLENQSIKNQPHGNSNGSSSPQKKSINRDIDLFLEKLENLDINKANSPTSSISSAATITPLATDLRNQVKLWQRRYEELRSSNIAKEIKKSSINKPELKPYVSPQGLISIRLVSDVYALIDSFFIYINQPNFDSDILFEKISKISIVINEIANQGECNHLNTNEHSMLLREAVTHALTATRYHATYKNLLPKFVVEKAINELVFLVCDLIAVCKLNENSANMRILEPQSGEKAKTHQKQSSLNEDFGVRPLRMANKLKQSRSPTHETATLVSDALPVANKNSQPSPFVEAEQTMNEAESSPFLEKKKSLSPERIRLPEKKEPERASTEEESSPFLEKKKSLSPERVRLPEKNTTPERQIKNGSSSLNSPLRSVNKLASKFENTKTTPTSSPQQSLPYSKDRSTPSPSNGVRELAQRLTTSAEGVEKNETPSRTPKKSILDKVRQFEISPQLQRRTESPPRETSESNGSTSYTGNDTSREVVNNEPIAKKAEEVPRSVSGGSRGLLQSLRARVNDADKVSTDGEGDAGAINKSDTTTSDNELDNTSTAETTPSEETDEHESHDDDYEKSPNVSTVVPENKSLPVSQETLPASEPEEEEVNVPVAVSKRDVSFGEPRGDFKAKEMEKKPSKSVTIQEPEQDSEDEDEDDAEMEKARQRQEARKSMAAAHFNIDLFDIDDPDNTLTQVLLYLEHQTVEVINTIQSLLVAIKKPEVTRGELRIKSSAITKVITQMTEATRTSMNQTRNYALKEHGSWVVQSLEDCTHRMLVLCKPREDKSDSQFGDKNFKQRLAGISFDIAKCIKELVKSVEEASLKEDIAQLETRLSHIDDLN
ncbi:uncharacterized protein SPAPADRAFT_51046 [Spathaspora passalidarum NRRL Y-27907]|uniref:GIT Spa2 homology (SHD) domain-containing protein n=1 Tax=Spathaspora passalidarum (strain NRRL Y-27907 / 11-Y1) TaxID=619300 RepID=G3ANB2_SPAPN|nr:uncharacterized protein SPAPADRAFT_51046 [Spathaspora passalidarum NRRL Y-27907]EGW32495.1 hypothetical protein SPAPADRAFT_51046 [Spathaspora passalidarum NRRL Y-27907]